MIGNIITAFNSSIPGLPFSGSVDYLVLQVVLQVVVVRVAVGGGGGRYRWI
jgi:hypothetical protein